ncbi:unnamed protein product [Oikopleura dioica]|uniref:Uncharacterized protein n=1 Tax=Oikopleura dioica TaxID=34765 RepID=E4Y3X3_OIKDI|nr:unnamed protein product [Oikopleura dioica]
MIFKQKLSRVIFVIALRSLILGYFTYARHKRALPDLEIYIEDSFSAWEESLEGKLSVNTDLKMFIDGKVVNALLNDNKVSYNESKVFCASNNLTLPRTTFNVIEKGFEKKSLFWIADNEETRSAASEKNREHLYVAFTPKLGGLEICALLISELANPKVPLLYLCEDEVYDDFGRLIWHKNLTVGCDLFKCNKTFIMNQGSESRPKVDCASESTLQKEDNRFFCLLQTDFDNVMAL